MTSKQWNPLRQPSFLMQRYDRESSAAAGFPIDGQEKRIRLYGCQKLCTAIGTLARLHLDKIRIPGISRHPQSIVALFLSRNHQRGLGQGDQGGMHFSRWPTKYMTCRSTESA